MPLFGRLVANVRHAQAWDSSRYACDSFDGDPRPSIDDPCYARLNADIVKLGEMMRDVERHGRDYVLAYDLQASQVMLALAPWKSEQEKQVFDHLQEHRERLLNQRDQDLQNRYRTWLNRRQIRREHIVRLRRSPK